MLMAPLLPFKILITFTRLVCAVMLIGTLAACSTRGPVTASAIETSPTLWNSTKQMQWETMHFPGKTPTLYSLDRNAPPDALGRRIALRAQADKSASMLRTRVQIAPEELGQLQFSWLVPALIQEADMATRLGDDSPVRLVLAFEGDRSNFSAKDAALNEMTRLVTGEQLPYATLMYVWCNKRPVGSVIQNARTERIRKIVVESGPQNLKQWQNYQRDIRADFEAAFGEAPGPLVGIGIMTDSDNTQSQTSAWYGSISLK